MSLLYSEPSSSSESLPNNQDESTTRAPKSEIFNEAIIRSLPPSNQAQIRRLEEDEASYKVTVRFQPIGSTPSVTPRVVRVSSNYSISTIIDFLVRKLKVKDRIIYLYVQNSFQPCPDEKLGELYELFKTNNELIISYCYQVAFG